MRHCYACDSNTTKIIPASLKRASPSVQWFANRDLVTKEPLHFLCRDCFGKLGRPGMSKGNYKERTDNDGRTLCFRGRHLTLVKNPRTGKCAECGAVKGVDCTTTHIHHEQYDEFDPLAFTVELCPSCHAKKDWVLRKRRSMEFRKAKQYGMWMQSMFF